MPAPATALIHDADSLLAALKEILASGDFTLTRLGNSLNNQNYQCTTPERNYFVKLYRNKSAAEVQDINSVTAWMGHNGIPVPQIAIAGHRFCNLVVQDYVEGDGYRSSLPELRSVASVLSRIVKLGAHRSNAVAKSRYLAHLQGQRNRCNNSPSHLLIPAELFRHIPLLFDQTIHALAPRLPTQIVFSHVHTDFNGRNLFFKNDQVSLVYDWESYRPASLHEHFASIIGRMCTNGPLQGILDWDKVSLFLSCLSPELRAFLLNSPGFPAHFPYLAALGHLRMLLFRHHALERNNRIDLIEHMLVWPISYCNWLICNAPEVAQEFRLRLHST